MMNIKAKINELFVSLQGEGPYVGVRQAFVRLAGCNMNCRYCDTDYSVNKEINIKEMLGFIRQAGRIHSVAFTGGEPLFQCGFLVGFLPELKKKRYTIYLETNGVLYSGLRSIIRWVDIVAMDIKLPSVTGQAACWKEHEKFIKIAQNNKKELFLKVVVAPHCNEKDINVLVNLMKRCGQKIVIILQPEHEYVRNSILMQKMDVWQQKLSTVAGQVRIVPQVHKLMEIK